MVKKPFLIPSGNQQKFIIKQLFFYVGQQEFVTATQSTLFDSNLDRGSLRAVFSRFSRRYTKTRLWGDGNNWAGRMILNVILNL